MDLKRASWTLWNVYPTFNGSTWTCRGNTRRKRQQDESEIAQQVTGGLPKWGLTEAVFQLFVFQFGFISSLTLLI